jgi:signal transduction histidine kinase
MISQELRSKLTPAAFLLACYFAAPLAAGWFMGAHDVLFASVSVSGLVQLMMCFAVLYELGKYKREFSAELTAWMRTKHQPQAKEDELYAAAASAAKVLAPAAFLLPPLGNLLPSSALLTLAKLCVVVYAAWSAYGIWKLLEPFMAYLPPSEDSAAHSNSAVVMPSSGQRCAKCGQALEPAAAVCAFCGQPVPKP